MLTKKVHEGFEDENLFKNELLSVYPNVVISYVLNKKYKTKL